jgi:hypothetical protein
MSKLKELRERVERACGPDQHLDAEIASCLFGGEVVPAASVGGFVFKLRRISRTGDGYTEQLVSPVTASIDAALALVERKLEWRVAKIEDLLLGRRWCCELMAIHANPQTCVYRCVEAQAYTLPLAILSALDHRESSNG